MNTQTKFKADPYNFSNKLITNNDIIDIMKKINMDDFKPNNISFYQEAFIHKSYNLLEDYKEFKKPDNCLELQDRSYETLEFLGDSLLGCMTAEYLYLRFEGEDEGFMTKIKTRIVNGEQLCYLATQLGMNKHLIISKHIEDNCSGRENQHILEDVLEAFIGALYLDTQDYQVIRNFVFNLIECFLDLPDIILNDTKKQTSTNKDNYSIVVGTFKYRKSAEKQINLIKSKYPITTSSKESKIVFIEVSGKKLYESRFLNFSKKDAYQACRRLAKYGRDCFVRL